MRIKKGAVCFILSLLLILISGCETIKGISQGATGGATKDWNAAKQLDEWIRNNLW